MGDPSIWMNQIMEIMKLMLEEHKAQQEAGLAALTTRIDSLSQSREALSSQRHELENSNSNAPMLARPESVLGGQLDNNFVP